MQKNNNVLEFSLQTLKSVGIACLLSVLCVFVFAFVLYLCPLQDFTVTAINQIIKAFCIFFGCMGGIRNGKGIWKGMLVGVCTVLLTGLVFGVLTGTLAFTAIILVDAAFGLVAGGICGIVAVNVLSARRR